ncbi:MAG: ComEA family DNA-binding protein [Bacteroidota bacterium]|jgi:comEA protein
MVQRFVNWLALTRSEQRVLLFLSATLIVGAGIRLYQDTFPTKRQFDYRSIDSSFAVFKDRLATDSLRKKQLRPGETVNINSASKEELIALPGIGATLAERIISYRENEGEFGSIEDLQKVKGISKKKLEKLKPHVTVQ